MPLVAAAALVARPVGAERGQRAEVVERPRAPAAQDLDSLLRHRRGAETRVVDRRHRAVSVLNRDRRALGRVDARTGRDSGCEDALRGAAQPVREVEHVARLAEDPAAALVRVVEPVLRPRRARSCGRRAGSGRPARGPPRASVRESGANGRLKPIASRSFSVPACPDVVDLLPRQAERLLDEDGLAGAQRRGGDLGVRVVPGADDDEIDVRRLDRLAPVGARPGAVQRAGERRPPTSRRG